MSDEYMVKLDRLDSPVMARCQACGHHQKVDETRPMCYNCIEYPGKGYLFLRAERALGSWSAGFQFVVTQLHTTDNDEEVAQAIRDEEMRRKALKDGTA